MSKLQDRFFYHGAPCSIETFDYAFTGQGTDQHGSGFYFTTDKTEASGYCMENDVSKGAGIAQVPTLHKVKLNLQNPLDSELIAGLTLAQAIEIISRAPDVEDSMWNWEDLGRVPLDKAIRKAAIQYSSNDESTLIRQLNMISNDFYGENIGELNAVLKDVLGYDGVIHKQNKRVLAVAWFPEQIQIVQRITDPRNELDESPSP